MRRRDKFVLLILSLGVVIFYLFPLLFTFGVLTMALLVFINPIYSFIFSLLYTIRFGLRLWFPASIGVLFIPSIFIFYDASMLIYALAYAGIAFLGSCLGYPIYKRYE